VIEDWPKKGSSPLHEDGEWFREKVKRLMVSFAFVNIVIILRGEQIFTWVDDNDVTRAEDIVKIRWKGAGWEVFKGGAPDFLSIKRDSQGNITEVKFVEVKSDYYDGLQENQKVWKEVLELLNAKYELRYITTRRRYPLKTGQTYGHVKASAFDFKFYYKPSLGRWVIRSRHSISDAEKRVKEELEALGYELLERSKGAPDFLMIKRDEKGKIKAVRFVEVKSRGDRLTPEQELYRQVLEQLIEKARSIGALSDLGYEVEYVDV
jgi:hypothetical protein